MANQSFPSSLYLRLREVAASLKSFPKEPPPSDAELAKALGISRSRFSQIKGNENAKLSGEIITVLTSKGWSGSWIMDGVLPKRSDGKPPAYDAHRDPAAQIADALSSIPEAERFETLQRAFFQMRGDRQSSKPTEGEDGIQRTMIDMPTEPDDELDNQTPAITPRRRKNDVTW